MMNNLSNIARTLRMVNDPIGTLQGMINQSPVYAKTFEMVQGKNDQEIMKIAENLAKSQGKDLNQLQQQILRQIGM